MNRQNNQVGLKIAISVIVFAGIVSAIGCFTIGIDTSKGMIKLISVCTNALFYGLLGALCYSIFNNNNTQQLSLIGISICGFGFLLNAISIMTETQSQGLLKAVISFFILSIAFAQICMLYKITIVNKYAAIAKVIAVVAISIFSFMMIVLIMGDITQLQYRMMGGGLENIKMYLAVLAIDFSATAATPLLNKLAAGRYEEENLAEEFLKDIEPEKLITPTLIINDIVE
jgi:hypothetical protein